MRRTVRPDSSCSVSSVTSVSSDSKLLRNRPKQANTISFKCLDQTPEKTCKTPSVPSSPVPSSGLPKMHQNPYRQSSAGSLDLRTVCRPVVVSPELRTASSAPSPLQTLRIENSRTFRTSKVYAWQMANGAINSPQMDTPCIAPMWDQSKPQSITTSPTSS